MKKKFLLISLLIIYFSNLFANEKVFFEEGKKLFLEKKYDDAKFKFEKDIVFNPKNEKSYLYLAKIYNKKKLTDLEENNLNTVILLNPKNEEAVYDLALLNIKKSNFKKAKKLIDRLSLVCKDLCEEKKSLTNKLNISSN